MTGLQARHENTTVINGSSATRSDMQDVSDAFANSVNAAVKMDGILSFHTSYEAKYSGLFNMDQTAICMDNPGKPTIEYRGTRNVDVIQGSSENSGRCTVFLCASATGQKLAPFVVFAGVPGCRVSDTVTAPSFGSPTVEHTVQAKAWCDHAIMKEWIAKIWRPSVEGCRMLLLDSLKVHKTASIRQILEDDCATQVQYIPPGVTGLSQPMDVSVMASFKTKIQDLYVKYHIDHPFPADTAEKRVMLSFLVAKAWELVKAKTIVKGFRKANLLPIGPRDVNGVFATYLRPLPEVSIVDEEEDNDQ